MTDIILNLEKSEFDEFNLGKDDLWQQDAAHQLIKHLTTLGRAAKEIKDRPSNMEEDTTRHVHDAILISGDRGSGKSIFLYNAKTLWDEQNDKNKPDLHFLDPVDPTLLQDNDSFSNVIIANIINSVHKHIKGKPQAETKKFYDRLRKLAESIEDVDKQQLGGLDKLMHYSSGVRVQNNFYRFVKEAITLLCCDALVLPIDDVDMALGKAYDVLEEIRRRLCCPFIIPLVSGDPDLYEHLVKINFGKSIASKDIQEIESTKKRLLDSLPNAYLTKVLPHHYRITLQSIDAITSKLKIKWYSNDGVSYTRPYLRESAEDTYQDRLLSCFFGPKHDDEKGRDFPWPKSPRELGQMVRLLRPDDLQSKKETDRYRSLLENLKTWSSACQHGASYTLALSALEFKNPCRASQLIAFNLHKQAKLNIPWAKYDFISAQKNLIENYPLINPSRPNSSKNSVATANTSLIDSSLNHNVLRSMPPIEFHLDKMSITKAEAVNQNPILLAIYTYNAYYGTQGNKQLKIYFSRAIELLFTSILNATQGGDNNNLLYSDILEQAPFYSIYNLNPTKQVEEEVSANADDESVDTAFNAENENIIEKINEWDKKHADIISNVFKNHCQTISLLSAVFNKTLTQIGNLRKSFKTIQASRDDELIDLALRFKYITINSFAFFLKENGLRVKSNIAIDTKVDTLRNATKFTQSSNTYRENIEWVESSNSIEAKFIRAIAEHPIFVTQDDITNHEDKRLYLAPAKTEEKTANQDADKVSTQAKQYFYNQFKDTIYDNPTALLNHLNIINNTDATIDNSIKEKVRNLFSDLQSISSDIENLSDRYVLKKIYTLLMKMFKEQK